MKVETEYDEHGWKLSVTKTKIDGVITIRQRRKGGCHMSHKPMTLRLRSHEVKNLKKLLIEVNK